MLNIHIIAVGKIKETYYSDAIAEYIKRLTGRCRVQITEIADERLPVGFSEAQKNAALEAEGRKIMAACPKNAVLVPLCVEGKQTDSTGFSRLLFSLVERGTVVFIIGGSHGLSDAVKSAGHTRMSFSKMTLPHRLFRVVLAEQIYRAVEIERGTEYHK